MRFTDDYNEPYLAQMRLFYQVKASNQEWYDSLTNTNRAQHVRLFTLYTLRRVIDRFKFSMTISEEIFSARDRLILDMQLMRAQKAQLINDKTRLFEIRRLLDPDDERISIVDSLIQKSQVYYELINDLMREESTSVFLMNLLEYQMGFRRNMKRLGKFVKVWITTKKDGC